MITNQPGWDLARMLPLLEDFQQMSFSNVIDSDDVSQRLGCAVGFFDSTKNAEMTRLTFEKIRGMNKLWIITGSYNVDLALESEWPTLYYNLTQRAGVGRLKCPGRNKVESYSVKDPPCPGGNLRGRTIKWTGVGYPPTFIKKPDGSITGIYVETALEMAQAGNFKLEFVDKNDFVKGAPLPNGSWTGVVGRVLAA